jgi:hypothetical protein
MGPFGIQTDRRHTRDSAYSSHFDGVPGFLFGVRIRAVSIPHWPIRNPGGRARGRSRAFLNRRISGRLRHECRALFFGLDHRSCGGEVAGPRCLTHNMVLRHLLSKPSELPQSLTSPRSGSLRTTVPLPSMRPQPGLRSSALLGAEIAIGFGDHRRPVLPLRGTGSASRRGRQPEAVNVRTFSHPFRTFSHPFRTPEMACLQGKHDQEAISLFGCDHTPGCLCRWN